ncbi:MAG: aldehyde dehydrogenase [Clostridia bacterium]|nr:aldehyde dehydrogenase [Clostridia bacterium]
MQDMQQILKKQKEYFATGETLPVRFRIDALKKLRAAIYANEDKINEALKADLGKSSAESYICETGMTLSEISYLIKHVKKWTKDKRVRTPLAQFASKSYVKKSPYGCTLIMSPWNYPFMLTLEPLADAIAAGNTAIVKPSAYSPATSEIILRLISEIFDEKYIAVVTGGRAENSQLLDMDFDKIFFTGSVAVGKEVMRKASEKLIPVTLELGGKSPCIVDETAKLSLAAKRIAFGKFLNCGQTCVAPDYVLVHESVKDKFLQELKKEITSQYGEYPLENANYGKIISQKHYTRVKGLIDQNKIYLGGQCVDDELRIAPTVLDGADWSDAAMGEEIFGPVLPVIAYKDIDSVIAKVNSGNTPLALYLFSSDKNTIKKVTSRIAFGGGCVNDTIIHLATSAMGFGGCGESGMGSYHGKDGFDCFTHNKSIVDKKTFIDLPMRYQPYTKSKIKLTRMFLK